MADKSIVSNSKLTAIANAIRSKTGTTDSLTLDNMVTAINNISGGSTNTLKKLLDATKTCYYLFEGYRGTSVDDLISYNDTENVDNMNYMFYYCTNLQTIPQLDMNNVTTMDYMFYGCYSLQTIPQLNTSKVTTMGSIFYDCNKLQTIDITSMDMLSSTISSSKMCDSCYPLTKFIIRTMTKVPPLNTNSFTNCYHFDGTVHSKHNPDGLKDGRIYVPDNMVDSLKSATNWSKYADIIVPLSTLIE